MSDECLICHRPLAEHSFNTADICNSYIGPDRADDIVGHKTFDTGERGEDGFPVLRHEPLTRAEANALWGRVEAADKQRADPVRIDDCIPRNRSSVQPGLVPAGIGVVGKPGIAPQMLLEHENMMSTHRSHARCRRGPGKSEPVGGKP